jgi:hypothetical protein
MTEAKEVTCFECERVWPAISEQGICVTTYNKCYSCLISQVVALRDTLEENALYLVHDCTVCGGIEPAKATCIKCGGKGWETTDKEVATSPIEIVH